MTDIEQTTAAGRLPLWVYEYGSKFPEILLSGEHVTALFQPFSRDGGMIGQLIERNGLGAAYVGMSDPIFRSVWQCWANPELRERVESAVDDLQAAYVKDSLAARKGIINTLDAPTEYGTVNVAAARISLNRIRRFGDEFPNEKFEYTDCPEGFHLSACEDCRDATRDFTRSGAVNAVALILAPVYRPKRDGVLLPDFPGHRPHDTSTAAMHLNSVKTALESGRCKFVAAVNMFSRELDRPAIELATQHEYELSREDLIHGVCIWTFEKRTEEKLPETT